MILGDTSIRHVDADGLHPLSALRSTTQASLRGGLHWCIRGTVAPALSDRTTDAARVSSESSPFGGIVGSIAPRSNQSQGGRSR
jgi:hypothetical protein